MWFHYIIQHVISRPNVFVRFWIWHRLLKLIFSICKFSGTIRRKCISVSYVVICFAFHDIFQHVHRSGKIFFCDEKTGKTLGDESFALSCFFALPWKIKSFTQIFFWYSPRINCTISGVRLISWSAEQ